MVQLLQIARGLVVLESVLLIAAALLPPALVPGTGIPVGRSGDFEHLLSYLVYGILLALAFSPLSKRKLLPILIIGLGMGLFTEALQMVVPVRTWDILDLLVNSAGVFLGITAVILIKKSRLRKSPAASF